MKNLLLILAVLLIPAATFADEKPAAGGGRSVAGNKPAPASAKKAKVKEKCAIPVLEHEESIPGESETITVWDPIPDNLSPKCFCEAVIKRYEHKPGGFRPVYNVCDLCKMPDKEYACLPKGLKKYGRKFHCEAAKKDSECHINSPLAP